MGHTPYHYDSSGSLTETISSDNDLTNETSSSGGGDTAKEAFSSYDGAGSDTSDETVELDTSGSIEQEAAVATDPYRAEDLQKEAERAATGQTSLFTPDLTQAKTEADATDVSAGGSTVTATDTAFQPDPPEQEPPELDQPETIDPFQPDTPDEANSIVGATETGVGTITSGAGRGAKLALVAVVAIVLALLGGS